MADAPPTGGPPAERPPTKGPLTHGRILNIAVPVVLANITVPLLGLVDTGVVGQMGEAAPIGAVGIGAIILTGLYWIFGFLRMGTTGFAAQARGAGDRAETAAILIRALGIAALGGLLIIALQAPLFALGFWLSPASAEVEALARSYMAIRVWSAPFLIATYAITGWLVAAERTRAILVIQLVMNGINIVLDLVFVLGFGWGGQGVAIATVAAEVTGCVLGLWYCRAGLGRADLADRARLLDPAKLRRFASVNADIMVRSLLLQSIFMSFLFFGARYGDTRLAANQILLQFLAFTAHAMDGFAFAVEALVGRALGAADRPAFRRASVMVSLWGAGIGVLLAGVFLTFGGAIIDMMTTAPDVRLAAREYLIFMALTPFLSAAPFMLDGIFIGATRTRDMRNMMAVSTMIYFAAALALMPLAGNTGLWIALLISFAARGATLGLKYPALERSI
ncbi:MATE family efflux transporter [Pseudooctadecabacter jejudonensis]|uniref:DNA-damage-inducible protein F n=1 Tax=Pseudooctadecabacter jejudonensis TaxID=1391910 RepID=A0A1Y5SLC9_9RHOB|nr:MATE family efflux transporter [Pseudooctadecabacter jejudonensis]SLN42265.1 DNA-damage-inducible protein F [Pseudooctadecabacter jejudonensis]